MKKMLLVITILALTLCNDLFSQIVPTSREPIRTTENTVAKKPLSFECPQNVLVGVKEISGGWQVETGIFIPFNTAQIIESQKKMACFYVKENSVIAFTIDQPIPTGYTCKIEKLTDKDRFNRKFICQPIPTAPKIIPKTN